MGNTIDEKKQELRGSINILLNLQEEEANLIKKLKSTVKKGKIHQKNLKYNFSELNSFLSDDFKEEISPWLKESLYVQDDELMTYLSNYFLIREKTSETFRHPFNILPYALKSLKVQAYEGINEAEFLGLPIDTQWIFLIGENGQGKTSLLRSIVIGFVGESDDNSELFNSTPLNNIGIEYFDTNISIIRNVGIEEAPFPHLACYGSSRLQIQTDQSQNDIAKKSTMTYSLFNSDGILLNIEFELLIWFLEKNIKFEKVKSVFLKLIPYLSDIQVDVPNRKILYIEKEPTEDGDTYNPVTFEQLASGFRSLILMIGDMMIRLFKSQPTINEPSELAGIVIIDELDLHWHPKLQRELPKLFSSIFPKVQFIASTHSLVPLLGAPENSVFLQVNRTKEAGVTVERITEDIAAFSADKLLRDVFDLDNKYMSDGKIKAWERYLELKALIRFEEDKSMKDSFLDQYELLGDKYNFSV